MGSCASSEGRAHGTDGRRDESTTPAQRDDAQQLRERRLGGEAATVDILYRVQRAHVAANGDNDAFFRGLFPTVELGPAVQDAFPVLLSYVYGEKYKSNINTRNATALLLFANLLEVKKLEYAVDSFVYWDMTPLNCVAYYSDGKLLGVDSIKKKATTMYRRAVGYGYYSPPPIPPMSQSELDQTDASFWLAVTEMWAHDNRTSLRLSRVIAAFCSDRHGSDVDSGGVFAQLTDASRLPSICSTVAWKFLELEQEHGETRSSNSDNDNEDDDGELTSLQRRCVEALVIDWHAIDLLSESKKDRIMSRLSPAVLRKLCRRGPAYVSVEGARTRAVNGDYRPTKLDSDGAYRYEMDGVWEGRPKTFQLVKCNGLSPFDYYPTPSPGFWYICTVLARDLGETLYFYKAPVAENCLFFPPKEGWVPASTSVRGYVGGQKAGSVTTSRVLTCLENQRREVVVYVE